MSTVNVSRRGFLKGGLAIGGSAALAGLVGFADVLGVQAAAGDDSPQTI